MRVATERRESRIERISWRAILIGCGAVACAALLAILTRELGPGSGVAIFMLAVTIAAVSGGIWAGVVAALLSSLIAPVIEHPDLGILRTARELGIKVVAYSPLGRGLLTGRYVSLDKTLTRSPHHGRR